MHTLTPLINIEQLPKGKQIFFISDLHLPICASGTTADTHLEDKVITWLDHIKPQAQSIFFLGDIFDFWFEYKYLIPRVALRFQAKLQELNQIGISIYFFLGNHDYWSKDYLTQRCGVQLFNKPALVTICNQRFFLGHGDTINPSLYFTFLLKLYHSTFLQSIAKLLPADWLYSMVHHYGLKKNNLKQHWVFEKKDRIFLYCKEKIEPFMHHDFYIFGHTHVPCIESINGSSCYCNLGDWPSHHTYASFDGLKLALLTF